MELQNDRIINGLLKADLGFLSPDAVEARLAQDIAIYVEPKRAVRDDLWPCVWFLASALERQFTGRIFINAGLAAPLSSPIPLGPRCEFTNGEPAACPVTISLGQMNNSDGDIVITGDARGTELSYGRLVATTDRAHPITCSALAGYLGFSALAQAVGIPPFRENWRGDSLRLLFDDATGAVPPFSILGTGQVGQALLAISYFLASGKPSSVHLLDKDLFEDYNQRTQILLSEDFAHWVGKPKVEHLAAVCSGWGWNVVPEQTEITWGWQHDGSSQAFAFLGFDNMDARRIAVEGGYPWIFECGVGTDFGRPRVSWHSIPPNRSLAKKLFADTAVKIPTSAFAVHLSDSPAECGRVTFENIQAAAPSLGLVAAAMTWTEAVNFIAGERAPYSGTAYLWSPLLPAYRQALGPVAGELKIA